MPLHLLHHKSYHVYSAENIARVKADEALAEKRKKEEGDRAATARIDALRAGVGADEGRDRDRDEDRRRKNESGDRDRDRDEDRRRKNEDRRRKNESGDAPKRYNNGIGPPPSRPPAPPPQRENGWDPYKLGRPKNELRPWYSVLDPVQGDTAEKTGDSERDNGRDIGWGRRRGKATGGEVDPLILMKSAVGKLKNLEKDREEWMRRREEEVRLGRADPEGERKKSGSRRPREDEDKDRRERRRRKSRSRSPSRCHQSHHRRRGRRPSSERDSRR